MSEKTVLISNICNNKCRMCFSSLKSFNAFTSRKDFKEKLKTYKRKAGNLHTVSLTGGEPTLNSYLPAILEDIRYIYPGVEIVILTNGRMFAYRDYLLAISSLNIPNLKIVVPLHAHTRQIHDNITQAKGSFEQTVRGIHNLMEEGFILEIRILINRRNYRYLRDTTDYIFNNFKGNLYLVYVAIEIGEIPFKNRVYVQYKEFRPQLEEALERERKDIRRKLYHFPLCVINKKYQHLICKSIEKHKLTFPLQCKACKCRDDCAGVLKTYVRYIGDSEFKPIKQ